MQRMQQPARHGGTAIGGHGPAERDWTRRCQGEPGLDELLNDPIMRLLWRRDRLDPYAARRQVRSLQQLVRHRAEG